MPKQYSSPTDLKLRFGGILENPYISKIHRHCLDGFKVKGLKGILKDFHFKNILDIGCGLGEYSNLDKGSYVGVDNSFPRVAFAGRQYRRCQFIQADAVRLPFKSKSFEAVLLANTAHHLNDDELLTTLKEMKRITSRYIIIDDCVRTPEQSALSKFFYRLDRGTMFRTVPQFHDFLRKFPETRIIHEDTHLTFPGLYLHSVFILEISKSSS